MFDTRISRSSTAIATAALLALLLWTIPLTLWEYDEPLFSAAIVDYEPLAHHPPPPGYPVYIGLAKIVNLVVGDPFRSLTVLSILGTLVAFVCFARAFGRMAGDWLIGLIASSLFYLSPTMLVHANVAMSDPVALGFLSVTLLLGLRAVESHTLLDAILFAIVASLTCGCRPQFSIIVVPMFLFVLFASRKWRSIGAALIAFTVTSLIWLAPLVLEVGGIVELVQWETNQAGYLADHDADVSRTGRTIVDVLFRFIAHPWGQKFVSFPLLIAAAIGFFALMQKRWRVALPFVAAASLYLLFALLFMDPADGARYSIPSTLFVALYAGSGIVDLARRTKFVVAAPIALLLFGFFFVDYARTLLMQRRSTPSPPAQAVEWIRANLPQNGIVLYELAMRPIADYRLADYRPVSVDKGLVQVADRPDVPAMILADGGTEDPTGKTFEWEYSDAYGKITRAHYRVVSVVPLPVEDRFWPGKGVYAPERTVRGSSWRWLAREASFTIPDLGARTLFLSFDLPKSYASETNEIEIFVNDVRVDGGTLHRDKPIDFFVDVPAGRKVVTIRAKRDFVPSQQPGTLNRDPRSLAVMLLVVEQRPAALREAA